MKHISIVIPQGHFSLVNVEGTYQILSWVNEYLQSTGRRPVFSVQLVGLARQTTQTSGLFTINPQLLIGEVKKTDLVILPAIHGDFKKNLEVNAALVPWIIEHYNKGAEIVGLCIGTFFLASTGLLDGKTCATHWRFANDFKKMFPKVHLLDDKVITDDHGIYTSGGAYSFTNLLVYLVEKFAGRDVAIALAKAFMIDIERNSQSPFIIFMGQKSHNDDVVLEAQDFIERNFQERINVDTLCSTYSVGRRTFERRFKKATSNTVVEYIQRVKIEAAKKELEIGRKSVNEVMYDVGYSDTKAFREVFRRFSGMSPAAYRSRYQKQEELVVLN